MVLGESGQPGRLESEADWCRCPECRLTQESSPLIQTSVYKMAAKADVPPASGLAPSENSESRQKPTELEPAPEPNNPNSGKTSSSSGSSSNSNNNTKASDESEFLIAADLTLYANPLRCLKKTSKPAKPTETSGSDIIAADLVKYGSPLDDNPN